jgi:hypothetical protein
VVDGDVIREMIRSGDRQYEALLQWPDVRCTLERDQGHWQISVTIFPGLRPGPPAPPRPTCRDAAVAVPEGRGVCVLEPPFPWFERPKTHRPHLLHVRRPSITFPDAAPRSCTIDEILPIALRTARNARIAESGQSPFACRRFRTYLQVYKEPPTGGPMCVVATPRRIAAPRQGILRRPVATSDRK